MPINYLIRRPPFRGSSAAELLETEVVKALRSHASETLEVRILGSASSSSVWYGTGKTSRKKDVGGYEVRRKDWETLLEHPLRQLRTVQWDERTVYMVSIHFVRALNGSDGFLPGMCAHTVPQRRWHRKIYTGHLASPIISTTLIDPRPERHTTATLSGQPRGHPEM